jgi:predicted Rossmann-fold nucleotide-binding protein
VAFPGGYGTFDEVFETLCLVQTGKRDPIPVVLVGRGFWSRAVSFQLLADEGMIEKRDLSLFSIAETAEEIWEQVTSWYAERGTSIFD